MQFTRYLLIVTLVLLVTACGRRLPDEYFDTNTDFEVASVEIDATATNEPVPATVESVESSSEMAEATAEEPTEPAVTEPEVMLVEVEPDPIIEQVANADPINGEALFNSGVPCSTCHQVDSEDMLVGPGFLNLPIRAENRFEDVVAERYIYTSIVMPNDYIVDGFAAAMPANYPDTYSDEEIYDIVAYLMTLGEYPEREPVFIEVPVEATDEVAEPETDDNAIEEETSEPSIDEDPETTPEVVFVVVTATPSSPIDDVTSSPDAENNESEVEATDVVVIAPTPNFELDMSDVPETISYLAEYGVVELGEALFMEELVDDMSCASCHSIDDSASGTQTDLSHVSLQDNAPSYIWAAIFSADLHGDLANSYERTLSGSDAAHLIAYLMSFNTVDE